MKDRLQFYLHKSYEPEVYHKQFQNDMPQRFADGSYMDYAKRTILVALPIISLDKRFASVLSVGSNTLRTISHIQLSISSFRDGASYTACGYELFQLSMSVTALAAACFNFTVGLFVITVVDILTNIKNILEDLYRGNYSIASEEALQLLSSLLYLLMITHGSLEATLAFFIFQAVLSLYHAQSDFADGKYIEAFGKSFMGAARIYQAKNQISLIQRRNALLKISRLIELINGIQNERKIDDLYDHPLINLADAASKDEIIIKDGDDKECNFGAHYFGYGKGLVKGMNLRAVRKDGYVELDFKVNHVFRDRLEKSIENLKSLSQGEIKETLKIFSSRVSGFNINTQKLNNEKLDFQEEIHDIIFEGLGSIIIGSSNDFPTLYDRVRIRFDKGKTLYDFHDALSLLHLEDAIKSSAKEDLDRLKIGQLFRIFDPKNATAFERSDENFSLSLEEYKKEVIERSPLMKDKIEKYLDKMDLEETLPGKMRFNVKNLAEDLSKIGAKGLTASITGIYPYDDESREEASKRLVSIMKLGLLSQETKHMLGVNKKGIGSGADYYQGSSDSVFTQMVTERTKEEGDFNYGGFARVLISPKILESGTYQYYSDSFGSRKLDTGEYGNFSFADYENRPDIVSFSKRQAKEFTFGNEVMVKERIPPKYIEAIFLDEKFKMQALQDFRKAGLVTIDSTGQETILGKAVDRFFITDGKVPNNF